MNDQQEKIICIECGNEIVNPSSPFILLHFACKKKRASDREKKRYHNLKRFPKEFEEFRKKRKEYNKEYVQREGVKERLRQNQKIFQERKRGIKNDQL